jgi:hypothetical protein
MVSRVGEAAANARVLLARLARDSKSTRGELAPGDGSALFWGDQAIIARMQGILD